MEAEILDDVITYPGDGVAEEDSSVLFTLVQRTVQKVCAKRYPFEYIDAEKETTVEQYRDMIFPAAIYYWAEQGTDGENSHSGNGTSRAYEKEDDIYSGVIPITKTI